MPFYIKLFKLLHAILKPVVYSTPFQTDNYIHDTLGVFLSDENALRSLIELSEGRLRGVR
jgi:hypothetical protein